MSWWSSWPGQQRALRHDPVQPQAPGQQPRQGGSGRQRGCAPAHPVRSRIHVRIAPVIVVAGGTGTLGSRLVPRLAEAGLAVRVLTRDLARARYLGPGVEVVRGDVRDAASLGRALHGAGTVISAVHGFAGPGGVSPASVDRAGNANLIDAASTAGAAFVLISMVGASPGHPIGLFRAKHAAEEMLRASRVPWTIVRATAFMQTGP